MQIHLLSGFLGSGKTTAIQAASRLLVEQGIRTGVITNDQGIKLVDGDFFRYLGLPGRQVINGCFCCNYHAFEDQIQSLQENDQPQVIFAESVGSCTDIVATVLKPLQRYRPASQATLSVFIDAVLLHMLLVEKRPLFDETVQYIYDKQLEEAGILILNKVDLLGPGQLHAVRAKLKERHGGKPIHEQHAADDRSVRRWLQMLEETASSKPPDSLIVDYPLYGAGEAMLAWLDEELEIECRPGGANRAALLLVQEIHRNILDRGYPIGHVKFLINGSTKLSFTSLPTEQQLPSLEESGQSFLLLNARVQTDPALLEQLMKASIDTVEKRTGARIGMRSLSSFQPGFPRPTHRMA